MITSSMRHHVVVIAVLVGSGCQGKSVPAPVVLSESASPSGEACIYAEGELEPQPNCPHDGLDRLDERGEPKGAASVTPASTSGTQVGHFGAPFALAEAKPLAEVLQAPSTGVVQVHGTVEAVCQKRGCWLVVADGTIHARVLMKDHGFAVPTDSRGKRVRVEGTLASRTFDEGQVKHLEHDAGRDPTGVVGPRTEHVLTATAVEIHG